MRERVLTGSIQAAVLVLLFGGWYSATASSRTLSLLLPPPPAVWRAMQVLWAAGQLSAAARVTVLTIIEAYAIAAIAGIAMGFAVSRSAVLVRLFEPVLSGLFAIPITLFFPLFILFFGIGPASKVAYGAAYSFFPIVLNTIAAFSSVNPLYVGATRSMGASAFQQFRYVYLPGGLPVTATGLRIGFFICVASVLGGETLAAASGVGRSIALAGELMETARMYAWIAVVVLTTLSLNLLALAAESRALRESRV